jgi:hypothetical protein
VSRRAAAAVAAAQLALVLAVGAGACGGRGEPRAPSRIAATDAIVRIRAEVEDASLWIDGRFIGAVGSLRGGVALHPGPHRLELRHEAYFVHYQELDLTPGQRLTLDVELAPLLP